jgi:serine/threonine protein kinase
MSEPAPTSANADRNLLFGILGLEMDFVDDGALRGAMHAWGLDKARTLGEILVEQGKLTRARLQLLEALVDEHLGAHGHNLQRSLAAVPRVKSATLALGGSTDADLQAGLTRGGQGSTAGPDTGATPVLGPVGVSPDMRYRVLRPHARGGLGDVFVAEDQELHRQVALKQIRGEHADNPVSRGRFLREAEVTGELEHPGIVPVYGVGQDAHGRPYYAMRFIRGSNLKEAIKHFHEAKDGGDSSTPAERSTGQQNSGQRNLEFRQLLGRFVDVCNTVAYAHSRGVLHRDLKPSNVMLGDYGETMVVDWGLAKSLDVAGDAQADDTVASPRSDTDYQLTAPGSALGTPPYASPEQAAGHADRIGVASDVYSLGATLYTLLTGRAPFEGTDSDLSQKVERGDFPLPRKINPAMPAPLEAICLHAMALQPDARYVSAKELAEEIEHWLADEPVSVWRETWGVRLGRWARRHRSWVAGASVLLLTATAALAIGLVVVNREKNRTAAEQQRTQQALEAEKLAREAETKAKKTAETREAETRAVLDFVQKNVFAAARPAGQGGGLGRDVTLRRAVEAALPVVGQSFTKQPLIEARLRMTLGSSFNYLGEPSIAAEQFQRARAIYLSQVGPRHPDTFASMHRLATSYAYLGRHTEAIRLLDETLALRQASLGSDHPDTLSTMNNLANIYESAGRYADSLQLRQKTLELRKTKLGPDHPDTLASMNNLANSYQDVGRHREALKLREETLALRKVKLGPDHPDTLASMNNMAESYAALGLLVEAMKVRQETLSLRKSKLGPDHPDTLQSMNNLAESYAALGRLIEALKLREETLALRKSKLGSDHPDTLQSMNNLAESYPALGKNAQALKLREETLVLRKSKLGPDHPDTLQSMNNLAESYAVLGRHVEAFKLREETLALRKSKLGPDHADTLQSMNNLSESYAILGRLDEALKLCEETLALRKGKLGPDHPDTLQSMWGVAQNLVKLDRGAEAVPIIDECVRRAAGKVLDPGLIPGVMNLRLRHFEKSKDAAACRATAEMWERLNRTDANSLFEAACYRAVTCSVIQAGRNSQRVDAEAAAEADKAIAWLKQAVAAGYKDAATMKNRRDLDSLHARDDFKNLLTQEAAKATPPH